MSDTGVSLPLGARPKRRRGGPGYVLRILGVTAVADYKLKYSGSFLGYFWSIGKPLAFFTMLYFIFGHVFALNKVSAFYPTSLLMGLVCFFFFADATVLGMNSLVVKESLLRKLIFPRVVIPISATLTAAITFMVNLVVLAVFIAAAGLEPQVDWLWLFPLVLELFAFTLGVTLILSTLFVRLRDIGQLWELLCQLFLYASAIMYPIGYLPEWARKIVFLNPFTQVLQDARSLVLYPDLPSNRITVDQALGTYGRLAPIAITIVIFVAGLLFFKREEPWFAERA
jgi:ABC-2 type transport system permease protein